MTAIVTGVYGAYDHVKEPVGQTIDCDFYLVTDNPNIDAPGWKVLVDEGFGELHPRLAAKRPKLAPWKFVDDGPWIWIDGSMQILTPKFAVEAIASCIDLGMWKHPDRDCIYPEAALSATLPKYHATPVLEQAEHYRAAGHPEHWGLWATGLIVYRRPNDELAELWMEEMGTWGFQDQISLPYALRSGDLAPPEPLPNDLRYNPWVMIYPHQDGTS